MSNDSDPKIVERLKGFPPYGPDKEPESPVIPQEDINKETEVPQEDIKEEEQIVEPAAKTEITEEEALANSKNPERTKEYIEKLKKQNEELRSKPNILDSLEPTAPIEAPQWPQAPVTNVVPQNVPGLSQSDVDKTFKGLVDENGYVDSGLLVSSLNEQRSRNEQLQKELNETRNSIKETKQSMDDYQRTDAMRQVHNTFPKLNPENAVSEDENVKFSDPLWKYVRREMVNAWTSNAMQGKLIPGEKKIDADKRIMMEVAKKGSELLNAGVLNDEGEIDINLLNMRKEDKAKLDNANNAKRNINATGASHTEQRNNYSDHESLIQANRQGKPGALAERLRQAGQ